MVVVAPPAVMVIVLSLSKLFFAVITMVVMGDAPPSTYFSPDTV